MSYFVTDKVGHRMTLETSEKLKAAEPKTYEERFPFKDKCVFCYIKGDYNDCESFINSQHEDVRESLVINNLN